MNRAAATAGVVAISNSYGGSDASGSSYGSYYNHPGIAVTVSSGDGGYGVEYTASSHYVTAVGGTHLTTASNTRGCTETAWSGAGSCCSAYNIALSGAATFNTGCGKRAVADVSAVADPATGVAVYESTGSIDNNCPYTHSTSLFDVTSGSNGSCTSTQWCNTGTGWDGPTASAPPTAPGPSNARLNCGRAGTPSGPAAPRTRTGWLAGSMTAEDTQSRRSGPRR